MKRPSLFIASSSQTQETTDEPRKYKRTVRCVGEIQLRNNSHCFSAIKPDTTDDILEELAKYLLKHRVSKFYFIRNLVL